MTMRPHGRYKRKDRGRKEVPVKVGEDGEDSTLHRETPRWKLRETDATSGLPGSSSNQVEDIEADTIEGRDGFKLIRQQLEVMNPPLIQNAYGLMV